MLLNETKHFFLIKHDKILPFDIPKKLGLLYFFISVKYVITIYITSKAYYVTTVKVSWKIF